jgi:hypothetical protein
MRTLVIAGLLLFGTGATVVDAATGPRVPESVQAGIKSRAGILAYVPTRTAIGFHYSGWRYGQSSLRIGFRNKAGWEITFVATPLRGRCRAGMVKSFQLDGNKVYWSSSAGGQQAWRCVAGSGGRQVRLAAESAQPPTKFADVGLGVVAASGKRIA